MSDFCVSERAKVVVFESALQTGKSAIKLAERKSTLILFGKKLQDLIKACDVYLGNI